MTEIPNLRASGVESHLSRYHMPRLNSAVSLLDILAKKKKLRVLSPRANYTDRAAAAGRRS